MFTKKKEHMMYTKSWNRFYNANDIRKSECIKIDRKKPTYNF